MLQFLRNNTKIIVWFAVILMVGVFGLSSVSLNKYDQYAGEVFGKKISFQEFRAFETLTRLLPPDPKISENPELEKQFTWQQVILSREAKNLGLKVSDGEVQARVDQIVNPEGNRPLSQDEYSQLLKSRRTTPNEFETGVRELIRIQKMMSQRFSLENVSSAASENSANTENADDKLQQQQAGYVKWMTDILQRSKAVDYSKKSRSAAAE